GGGGGGAGEEWAREGGSRARRGRPVPPGAPNPAPPPPAAPEPCPACGTPRKGGMSYCDDCGWMFSNGPIRAAAVGTPANSTAGAPIPPPPPPANSPPGARPRIQDRHEVTSLPTRGTGINRRAGP